jgi:hypothetical protein
MTDNQYLWMGITVDGICFLTAIYLVTVGNWKERMKEIKRKPKTVKNNFWTITKQEIIDEFKFDKNGY